MSDSINKLTTEEAQRKIQEIAKFGDVIPKFHCCQRMREKNYDIHDILSVLKNGKVTQTPEYDKKHCDWKYKVEGNVVEGEKATVVVVILSHRELACITIMPK